MCTHIGQTYRGRLTDQQRDTSIFELYKRLYALETSLEQMHNKQQDTAKESSSDI